MKSYKASVRLNVLARSPDGDQSGTVGCKYEREMELPAYVPAVVGLRIWLEYEKGEGDFMVVKEVELWPSDELVLNCVTPSHYMPEDAHVDYSGNMLVTYDDMLRFTSMLDRSSKWITVSG